MWAIISLIRPTASRPCLDRYGDGDRMSNLGGGLKTVDWSSARLEKFEKNFYVEDKRVAALSDREVEDFRKSKDIRVSGPSGSYCFM